MEDRYLYNEESFHANKKLGTSRIIPVSNWLRSPLFITHFQAHLEGEYPYPMVINHLN